MAKKDWAENWQEILLHRVGVEGRSVHRISKDPDMPAECTIYAELNNNADFAKKYAHARDRRAEAIFEETFEIVDDARNDWMSENGEDSEAYKLNGEHVQRSRLRVDQRKWALAKMAPKKFGDRLGLDVEVKGETLSEDQQIERVKKIIPQIAPILVSLGWQPPNEPE